MELTSEEGRVLGCLVEKQLTTPQQYPLTENALLAACNQATNRDPVVAYDVSTVRISARGLREKGLLRMVHRTGERSDKHHHLLDGALALTQGQMALLAVLLLRGPQTLAELRLRSERMHAFDTPAEVQTELDALTDREEPLVARLERQPGHKEARYVQLLVKVEQDHAKPVSDESVQQLNPLTLVGLAREVEQDHPKPVSDASVQQQNPLTLVGLAREVELLRGEVAGLRAQIDRLGGTEGR